MNFRPPRGLAVPLALFWTLLTPASHAIEPRLESWLTNYSARYARIYPTDASRTSGTSVSTWSNGSQTQASPAYCGVQEVYSSANWVYLRSTGLGSHVMGPWYLNAAHTQVFPNFPVNTKTFYRIPRSPSVPAGKTLTGLGAIGYFVDGVAMFDSRDGFVWTGSAESGNGNGYWNREAYVNEGVTFDPGYAHQEQSGTHHYHANPIALRHLLGDHVDYNPSTRTYAESAGPVSRHSPILGWVRDGFPVYGPYGYASASNALSGVRRMLSGYQRRDGSRGTDNLAVTGRTTIPAWAARLYNVSSNQAGPAVNATYPLGRYMEDNAFLGDLGFISGTDFDLDEYNGRWCVTPEFPQGTYAYFVAIDPAGTPVFPYNIGRAFFGAPGGGAITALSESVTTNFLGGASAPETLLPPRAVAGRVALVWSATEGGTYRVESSTNFQQWAVNATNLASTNGVGQFTNEANGPLEFYRVVRTGLAAFDPVTGTTGGGGASRGILSLSPTNAPRGGTFTLTVNLDPNTTPALPPVNAPVNSVTVGAIAGTSRVHVSQTQVTANFTIPVATTPGPQTVTVVFPGPPNNPTATVTYTLANGFTIE